MFNTVPLSKEYYARVSFCGIWGLQDGVQTYRSSLFLTFTQMNSLLQLHKTVHCPRNTLCTFLLFYLCLCCSYAYYILSLLFNLEKPHLKAQLKCHIYKKMFPDFHHSQAIGFSFLCNLLQHSNYKIIVYPCLSYLTMIQLNTWMCAIHFCLYKTQLSGAIDFHKPFPFLKLVIH